MSNFDRPGMTMERPPKRRSAASRFSELGDRLSRTFGGSERSRSGLPAWEPHELDEYPMGETIAWAGPEQRFPLVRQGYDCAIVDQHIDELESELERLKADRPSSDAVAAELDRIGEQTATIIRTAYEQAHEITRDAREQSDKCLAEAAANAVAMTEDANRRLRHLDLETDSVWQERMRLIEDARGVATELMSVAERATARFPVDHDKVDRRAAPPEPVAGTDFGQTERIPATPPPVGAQDAGAEPPEPTSEIPEWGS